MKIITGEQVFFTHIFKAQNEKKKKGGALNRMNRGKLGFSHIYLRLTEVKLQKRIMYTQYTLNSTTHTNINCAIKKTTTTTTKQKNKQNIYNYIF